MNNISLQTQKRIQDSELATGKKASFWYGMRLRPFSIGAQPDHTVAFVSHEEAMAMFSDKNAEERDVRFGAIAYESELDAKVIEHYNLTNLNKLDLLGCREAGIIHCENILHSWKCSFENEAPTEEALNTLISKIHRFFKEGEALKAMLRAGASKAAREQEEFIGKDNNPKAFAKWEASINCLSINDISGCIEEIFV